VLPYSDISVTVEEGVGWGGGGIVHEHILRHNIDWTIAPLHHSEVDVHQPKQADASDP
jgi:hypothetical protein